MFRFAFVLLLLSLPTGSRSEERSFYLTPQISFDTYASLGLGSGIDAGVSAGVRLSPWLDVAAGVAFGSRPSSFDLIGGTGSLETRLARYDALIALRILGRDGGAELAAVLGGGAVVSSVDARTISLGALGVITVPPRSETRGFLSWGLAAALPVSQRVAITLEPSLRLLTPLASSATEYSIRGGIRVGIL